MPSHRRTFRPRMASMTLALGGNQSAAYPTYRNAPGGGRQEKSSRCRASRESLPRFEVGKDDLPVPFLVAAEFAPQGRDGRVGAVGVRLEPLHPRPPDDLLAQTLFFGSVG